MKNIRIVFSTDSLSRGGKERQIVLLASELLKHGYDINIISLSKANNDYLSEYSFPVNNVFYVTGNQKIQKFGNFKTKIRVLHPNLVISFDSITASYNLLLFKEFRYIFINGCIQHGIRLVKLSHYIRSLVLWLSPYVLANSYMGLKVNNIRPSEKAFVLYNGNPEIDRINHVELFRDKNSWKTLFPYLRLGKKIVLIMTANFVPYKDYHTVLKALKELKYVRDFYFIALGDGPMRGEVEKQIRDYGLHNEVLLLGRVSNVMDYLGMADIYIHSSRGEGISNAVLEAMICGLPVVATDVGAMREVVYPKTSALFNYQDNAQLLRILNNIDQLIDYHAFKSKEYFDHLQKFSVEKMMSNFYEILSKVSN